MNLLNFNRVYLKLFVFSSIILFSSCSNSFFQIKNAEKGVVDLSNWDFETNGVVLLRGEFEFYWNQFLFPTDFYKNNNDTVKKTYIKVPGYWNNYKLNNSNLPSEGFATYRFKVRIKKTNSILSIKTLSPLTACKIYVNNKEIVKIGDVSITKAESVPEYAVKIAPIQSDSTILDFICHFSNYHHINGGMQHSIFLGTNKSLSDNYLANLLINVLILGCIFMMVLYHFVLFILRKKEKSTLYFAVFCLLIFIRVFIAFNHFEVYFFHRLKWEIVIFFELASFILAIPVFFFYFNTLFKEIIFKPFLIFIIFISSIIICILVCSEPRTYLYLVKYLKYWTIFNILYLFFIIFKAAVQKRESVLIFAFGVFLIGITAINDILQQSSIIDNQYLVHFGLFAFLFSQTFLLSKRFSKAFYKTEQLSEELKNININLEKIIEKRTEQINIQKNQLEISYQNLKELTGFKKDMMNMIVHDLKNPLNIIINRIKRSFKKSKSNLIPDKFDFEIIENTSYKMLYLINNILDVARFEESKIVLDKNKNSLNQSIAEAMEQVFFIASEKKISIKNHVNRNIIAIFDYDLITRVFINLLSNAIKFSEINSSVEINYEIRNDLVKISIIDFGIGISPDNQAIVFEKYNSSSEKKNENIISTGLGLAFSKLVLQAHGQNIFVVSDIGKGTTFTITLQLHSINEIQETFSLKSDEIKNVRSINKKFPKLKELLFKKHFFETSEIISILEENNDNSIEYIILKEEIENAIFTSNSDYYYQLLKSI